MSHLDMILIQTQIYVHIVSTKVRSILCDIYFCCSILKIKHRTGMKYDKDLFLLFLTEPGRPAL